MSKTGPSSLNLPSVEDIKAQGISQYNKMMDIPGRVMSNWPAFFGYAVVDYIAQMVIQLVPVNLPGMGYADNVVNNIYQSGVRGGVKVLDQVTWDCLKK
jgi:hypothetical protein